MHRYKIGFLTLQLPLLVFFSLLTSNAWASIVAPVSVSTSVNQPVTITIVNNNDPITIISDVHAGDTDLVGGQVVYTPNPGYAGKDEFSFSVQLADGLTGKGTVTIYVQGSSTSTPNEDAMDNVFRDSQDEDIQSFYKNLDQVEDPATVAQVQQSITPLQAANQLESSAGQSSTLTQQFSTRISGLSDATRRPGLEISFNGKSWDLAKNNKASASSDHSFSRLGLYINGKYGEGERINTALEVGAKSETFSFTLGSDFWLSDDWIVGAAFTFGESDNQYNRDSGQLMNRSYSGTLYSSYYVMDNLSIDGVFTATGNEYESTRNLLIFDDQGNIINTSAFSNHWGDQQHVSVGARYSLPIGSWRMGFNGRVDYGRINIDSYKEDGDSPFNLIVEDQFNDTVVTFLGADLRYSYSVPFGVLLPHIALNWGHEFKNDSRSITMRSAQDPTTDSFKFVTNSPDRDFLNFRAGLSAVFTHGISAFMQYETLLENRYDTAHSGSFGIRWEF